jgi:hypothetical protein
MKVGFVSILLLIFATFGNVNSQNLYYHFYDDVQVFTDSTSLLNDFLLDYLYKLVYKNDSISFWIIEADTCDASDVSGIPYCQSCSVGANLILQNSYKFSIIDEKLVVGTCWDYLNAIYRSVESSDLFRKTQVFNSKKSGPYAPKEMLKPGDWVYHINRQFRNIEHSAIFVAWKDYEKGIAITMSYMGLGRARPARYGEYDLNSVYAIFRIEDEFW